MMSFHVQQRTDRSTRHAASATRRDPVPGFRTGMCTKALYGTYSAVPTCNLLHIPLKHGNQDLHTDKITDIVANAARGAGWPRGHLQVPGPGLGPQPWGSPGQHARTRSPPTAIPCAHRKQDARPQGATRVRQPWPLTSSQCTTTGSQTTR